MAESERERLDRELIELLNEVRVMVAGIQVLFAFLLTVAFSQRFPQLSTLERDVYYATLLCTAMASILLIAPSVHHRVLFRRPEKEHIIFLANRLAIAGVAFLGLSIAGVLFLITDLLFGEAASVIVSGAALLLTGGLWFVVPLRRRDEEA